MNKKVLAGCGLALLQIFVADAIWFYLLFQILSRVGASDLMWFLFWVYTPVRVLLAVVHQLLRGTLEAEK